MTDVDDRATPEPTNPPRTTRVGTGRREDELLDEAGRESFPASDPPAVLIDRPPAEERGPRSEPRSEKE